MSSITIRNFDSSVKERLRTRAAENGRSMEAEARCILEAALKLPARAGASNLFERIRALVDPLGGIHLDLPPRDSIRELPHFH